MIDLDVKYLQTEGVEIAGDEESLLALCEALESCAKSGFDVGLQVGSSFVPGPHEKMLTGIVISINDMDNLFSVSDEMLQIEGDENFMLHVRSHIPWDAMDTHSGLSCQVHYDRSSFSDYLDEGSIDIVLTKKRRR